MIGVRKWYARSCNKSALSYVLQTQGGSNTPHLWEYGTMALTVSEHTARSVGSYDDPDGDKWRGAARKYLATVDGREYLVKPDIGWPSDRDSERVAAAFYRALGCPVPNVVNATIGGTNACAVRIIDGADPIGEGFEYLTRSEALDVLRGAMLSSLIGDGDRHQYNWIHDGVRAYAIDHGLAFSARNLGYVRSLITDYVYDMLDGGVITVEDIADVAANLPENAGRIAAMAWDHVQRNTDGRIPTDVRAHFEEYAAAVAIDYAGERSLSMYDWSPGWEPESEPEYAPDDSERVCDCSECRPVEEEPELEIVFPNRNILRCENWRAQVMERDRQPRSHRHHWSATRGWHSTRKVRGDRFVCICKWCHRGPGRQAGRSCGSGPVFGRQATDIERAG